MENLVFQETEYTPGIYFDSEQNVLEIKGKSYPENTTAFYAPVFSWLQEYFSQLKTDEITVNIEIVYFNSSSSKVLLDFFDSLQEVVFRGIQVVVNWLYEQGDDDMREYGEEFEADFRGITFNFIAK